MMKVKLNPKRHKGYILCRRLNKVVYIYKDAVISEYGFICDCSECTKLDPYFHKVFYKGMWL